MKGVRAVVLAAGEGTRMKSGLSKLAHSLGSQALIKFAVDACIESGISKIIIVVGHQAEKIRSILGEGFEYVYQRERLGTGHALKQAAPLLSDFQGELVVLPGDAPFLTPSVLLQLIQYQRAQKPAATVLTTLLPDPSHYGRVIKNGYRQIKKIVESKNASPEELNIREINSGVYCFDTQKVLSLLPYLERNNKGKEYYLTDVVELLNIQGFKVEAMQTKNSQVALGVNTPEELERAWEILERGKRRWAE